ncbi:histidine kinase [Amycolatopsis sp. NBC_00355]|uniref:sensor histidine kinase n=1 Tax=Amycolatopsis sp. NBC_00355 TaxID=2975957 RepID=UPI002E2753B4
MTRSATYARPGPLTAVAVVGAAVTAWGQYASGDLRVYDVLAGLLGCALVPLVFHRPVTSTLVAAVLAVLSPVATPPAVLGVLQVARSRPWSHAVTVAVAGVLAHALRGLWRPADGLPYGWWLVLAVLAHVAVVGLGALSAGRDAVLTALTERALRAEAEQGRRIAEAGAAERASIAREMHDVLAHRLSLLATYAGALELRPHAPPEKLAQAAGVVRAGAHQALVELREVIVLLHDDPVTDGTERPVPELTDLPGLVERTRAVGTAVQVTGEVGGVPGMAGRTAYRVVQEALTNARKHAPGQPVRIALGGEAGARLEIAVSNPLGPAGNPQRATGHGLVGLTERVRLAGGQLDHRRSGGEFLLNAWLPWPR